MSAVPANSNLKGIVIGLAGLALWLGLAVEIPDPGLAGGSFRVGLFGLAIQDFDAFIQHGLLRQDAPTLWVLSLAVTAGAAFWLYLLLSMLFRLRLLPGKGRLLLFLGLAVLVFLEFNPFIAEFLRFLPANRDQFTYETARTLRSLAALAAGLSGTLLLVSLFPNPWLAACARAGEKLLKPRVAVAAVAAAVALVLWIRHGPMQGLATVSDELSYLRQAEIFTDGRLSEASLEPRAFFDAEQMLNDGRYYSKYPPGTSLCLAPFALSSLRQAGPAFYLSCNLVLVFLLARRLFGRKAALLSMLLAAASPFFVLMGTGFLSHGPGLSAALGMAYFHALWLEKGRARFALVSGCFASLLFLIRPVTAAAVILPFLVHGQVAFKGSPGRRVSALLGFGAALCAGLAAMLLYNAAQTGDPFLFPYAKYAGLHAPYDRFGLENAERGVVNTAFNLSRLNHWLLGFAPSLLLVLAVFLFGAAAAWEILFGATFLLLAGAHVFHWFWGTPWYGPLYYYECAAFLILLAARGALLAFERLKAVKGPTGGVLALAGILLLLFSVPAFHADRIRILAGRVEEMWRPVLDLQKGEGLAGKIRILSEGVIPSRDQVPEGRERGLERGAWVVLEAGGDGKYLGAAPEWMTGGLRLLCPGEPHGDLVKRHPEKRIYALDN